jgi:hypothetical protein
MALGAVGFVASTTLGAGPRPWTPRACSGPPAERIAAAKEPDARAAPSVRGAPWFRLDPVLDAAGVLHGQRIAFGLAGDRISRIADLAAESFAAGPFGRVVLVGSDDGTASRLDALDIAAGCSWSVAEERAVIRRATIDPSGSAIYEARVDRVTRADLGIWLQPTDGRSPARRVLPPLGPDARFGRTFSTEFTWDLEGDRLAVQACGEVACRIRVISNGGGSTATLDAPDLGPMVGFAGGRVVTYAACRGLPCPIVSTDLASGSRRVLVSAAWLAVLASTPGGPRLIHETRLGAGLGLRSVALDTGASVGLAVIPDGLRLQSAPAQAASSTRVPPGWVLLAPEGRLPADGRSGRPELRRIQDGLAVPLDEAPR